MKHGDFRIGVEFWCGGMRWRCTDVGSRVIVAISLEPHEILDHVPSPNGVSPGKLECYVSSDGSWLLGPPYAVVERVFDEYELAVCSLTKDTVENGGGSGLSDPKARSILNQQIAELLRVILEQSANGPSHIFYCPMCGSELSNYEQPDVWVRGLRCQNDPVWAERGGGFGSEHFRLHAEPTEQGVREDVSAWLGDNPVLRSTMHISIRKVFDASIYARGAA